MEKLFESSLKSKYRYPFKGTITTEDLFDLSVSQLDTIFKSLNAMKKKTEEESLLLTKTEECVELDNKIEIVKYIVSSKLEEQNVREKEQENKLQKQKILKILESREEQDLQNKSNEELISMLSQLN